MSAILNGSSMLSRSMPVASTSTSSIRTFSTSLALQGTKKRRHIRQVKKESELRKRNKAAFVEATRPSPILGVHPGNEQFWEKSLLNQVLLKREQVWGQIVQPNQFGEAAEEQDQQSRSSAAATQATSDRLEQAQIPEHLNYDVTRDEADVLAKQLPLVSARKDFWREDFVADPTLGDVTEQRLEQAEQAEFDKRDKVMRIIDLRNANTKGIVNYSKKRIIEAFGTGDPNDTGRPEVQAALLTVKIRALHDHLVQNPGDIHNQRSLRRFIHSRAAVLKYLRTVDAERYVACLRNIGVEPKAVEGEIIINREMMRAHLRANELM